VAGLASSGELVLVLCADALRRRGLVERAALPARFGGGLMAIASGRLADAANVAAVSGVADSGSGVLLADWTALARHPLMVGRFEHVVLIDPPPFRAFERLAEATPASASAPAFLHLAWGEAEVELALRVHEAEWPSRASLAVLFRSLRDAVEEARAPDGLDEPSIRRLLEGPIRLPAPPEVAARGLRVLEGLGTVRWDRSGAAPLLRVVSSEAKDLEQIDAFVAYRARHEEGRRFLSRRRQET
jgi:hypothetical protein